MADSRGARPEYRERKAYFDRLLTLFGRNPVMEALQSDQVEPVRLHLADSNKPSPQLDQMQALAVARHAEVVFHSRTELSRISRNGRQDQGVALDVMPRGYQAIDTLLGQSTDGSEFIALDQITNPQNLGMIIRAVAGSPMAGLILPRRGGARIDGLVIKASAGALFHARLFHCDDLADNLTALKDKGYRIIGMDGAGKARIQDVQPGNNIFVLGNETSGLSSNVRACCDQMVSIPLNNQVESLNVSIAASIVAFRSLFN